MEVGAILLLTFGGIGIATACILAYMGFGKPIIGALSKSTRKAVGCVTRRFTKR